MDRADSENAQADAPLQKGDDVLVRGRVQAVCGDLIDVVFEPWWPPWSAIPVNRARLVRLPAEAPAVFTPPNPIPDQPLR